MPKRPSIDSVFQNGKRMRSNQKQYRELEIALSNIDHFIANPEQKISIDELDKIHQSLLNALYNFTLPSKEESAAHPNLKLNADINNHIFLLYKFIILTNATNFFFIPTNPILKNGKTEEDAEAQFSLGVFWKGASILKIKEKEFINYIWANHTILSMIVTYDQNDVFDETINLLISRCAYPFTILSEVPSAFAKAIEHNKHDLVCRFWYDLPVIYLLYHGKNLVSSKLNHFLEINNQPSKSEKEAALSIAQFLQDVNDYDPNLQELLIEIMGKNDFDNIANNLDEFIHH